MMRKTLVLMTALLVLATLASAANAQSYQRGELTREGRWDFTIQTRYTQSSHYDGQDGSYLRINSDLGWGFGFGYNISQNFNLGLLFTWRSAPYQVHSVGEDDDGNPQTIDYSTNMSTSTFGFSGEWNILKKKFTPYVNGSFGWMHINTNIPAGWTSGCYWYPYWGYVCGPVPLTYGSNETAYTGGLGLRYETSETVFLRGGYEWGWVSVDEMDSAGMMRIDIGFMF
jgi:opacity protein-like surface antigen